MTSNPSGQGFQNKNRVAILAELDKEKRKLLMQNQSSTNHPGASISLARSSLNKDFRDHAEQQHIAAQQKAALQVRSPACSRTFFRIFYNTRLSLWKSYSSCITTTRCRVKENSWNEKHLDSTNLLFQLSGNHL